MKDIILPIAAAFAVALGIVFIHSMLTSAQVGPPELMPWATRPNTAPAVVLTPGTGFTGATPQPSAVGNPTDPGYTARVISRWSCVPYQDADSDDGHFAVGAPAFHINGIDKVEMSLEGGTWTDVGDPYFNNASGCSEYWAYIDPDDWTTPPTSPVEVRLRAWPETAGEPRVLQDSMFVWIWPDGYTPTHSKRWVDDNVDVGQGTGTLADPFGSIREAAEDLHNDGQMNGGIIMLFAGEYEWESNDISPVFSTNKRWLTVMNKRLVDREDITIIRDGSEGPLHGVANLRLSGITIDDTAIYAKKVEGVEQDLWADGVHFLGPGQEVADPHNIESWFEHDDIDDIYITDCLTSDVKNGPINDIRLIRNTTLEDIGSDVFGAAPCVINCTVDNVDRGTQEDWHEDLIALSASGTTFDNILYYGVQATELHAQGIYLSHDSVAANNCAFVNMVIDKKGGFYTNMLELPGDHHLFWGITSHNMTLYWKAPATGSRKNISVWGGCWYKVAKDSSATIDHAWFVDNHYIHGSSLLMGTGYTTGEPKFDDAANNDFHPDETIPNPSPLVNSWADPPLRIDADLDYRAGTSVDVGALEHD